MHRIPIAHIRPLREGDSDVYENATFFARAKQRTLREASRSRYRRLLEREGHKQPDIEHRMKRLEEAWDDREGRKYKEVSHESPLPREIAVMEDARNRGRHAHTRRPKHEQFFITQAALNHNEPSLSVSSENWADQEVCAALGYADLQRLNTCPDWSVNRMQPEEELGLRPLEHIKKLQTEKYRPNGDEPCRHVDLGPGDNSLIARERVRCERVQCSAGDRAFYLSDCWDHVGYGDRLYASVSRILEQFIREDKRNDPTTASIVRVLSEAIERRLHQKMQTLEEGMYISPNYIFRLLKNPRKLLEGVYIPGIVPNIHEDHLVVSDQYTADTTEHPTEHDPTFATTVDTHRWLLEYQGMSNNVIDEDLRLDKVQHLIKQKNRYDIVYSFICRNLVGNYTPEHVAQLYERLTGEEFPSSDPESIILSVLDAIHRLEQEIAQELEYSPQLDPASQVTLATCKLEQVFTKIKKLHGRTVLSEDLHYVCATLIPDFPPYDQTHRPAVSMKNARMRIRNFLRANQSENEVESPSAEDTTGVIESLFVAEFASSVRHAHYYTGKPNDSERLSGVHHIDLNSRMPTYPEDFIRGHFDSLSKLPSKSAMLITAIRSQSHRTQDAFYKDVRHSMRLLEPGGCLVTDGIKESYSELLRLAAVPERFKAEVVMNRQTHQPLSLFVQRHHEQGYFTDEEKGKAFTEDVYLISVQDLATKRPDLIIAQSIREQLLRIDGIEPEDFRYIKGALRSDTDVHVFPEYGDVTHEEEQKNPLSVTSSDLVTERFTGTGKPGATVVIQRKQTEHGAVKVQEDETWDCEIDEPLAANTLFRKSLSRAWFSRWLLNNQDYVNQDFTRTIQEFLCEQLKKVKQRGLLAVENYEERLQGICFHDCQRNTIFQIADYLMREVGRDEPLDEFLREYFERAVTSAALQAYYQKTNSREAMTFQQQRDYYTKSLRVACNVSDPPIERWSLCMKNPHLEPHDIQHVADHLVPRYRDIILQGKQDDVEAMSAPDSGSCLREVLDA